MYRGTRRMCSTRYLTVTDTSIQVTEQSWQIELAFAAGYDPALELANRAKKHDDPSNNTTTFEWDTDGPWIEHLRRNDQDQMDHIVNGQELGHYFLLLGPKVRMPFSECPRSSSEPGMTGDR